MVRRLARNPLPERLERIRRRRFAGNDEYKPRSVTFDLGTTHQAECRRKARLHRATTFRTDGCHAIDH